MGSIISGAVITSNGKLTPSFEYIAGLREAQSRVNVPGDFSSEKKVNSQMFPAVESKCHIAVEPKCHISYNFEKYTQLRNYLLGSCIRSRIRFSSCY